jgi:hypothetical protein
MDVEMSEIITARPHLDKAIHHVQLFVMILDTILENRRHRIRSFTIQYHPSYFVSRRSHVVFSPIFYMISAKRPETICSVFSDSKLRNWNLK